MDEVRAMLQMESERQLLGCSDDSSCLSEIADALGADVALDAGQKLVDSSRRQPIDGILVVEQEQAAATFFTLGVGLVVAGTVVVAGAGVMALFTDWNNAAAAAAE